MAERKLLNGWKEIAHYLGRAVRSVQRYEAELNLPIRRAHGGEHSAVFAFADELDGWLQRASVKSHPYVRPILLVLDPPDPQNISKRKLTLELEKFNVLTAFSEGEVLATAQRLEVDGFVLNCVAKKSDASLCELLRKRYPRKKIFAVMDNGERGPSSADYVIPTGDPLPLLAAVKECFGKPRLQ